MLNLQTSCVSRPSFTRHYNTVTLFNVLAAYKGRVQQAGHLVDELAAVTVHLPQGGVDFHSVRTCQFASFVQGSVY